MTSPVRYRWQRVLQAHQPSAPDAATIDLAKTDHDIGAQAFNDQQFSKPALNNGIKYINVSQVASLSYCEQHVVWDHKLGRKRTHATSRRATHGTQMHREFENESKSLQRLGPIRSTRQRHSPSLVWGWVRTLLQALCRLLRH